jgi:succinate dehydrogenase/fumarate reductase flavoprotein subunit
VDAIRFRDHKYWIDPEKCISCGHCAQVCHNNVISDPAHPQQITPHEPEHLSCDVLVVGAGASGLMAAARAAEQGKKVLVLEKNKEIGGSAWYAHVFRSYYSKWHQEAGLPDTRDQVYQDFMEKTQGHVNGKLVRNVLDADQELIDWLIEKHDLGKDYTFGPQFWGGYGPTATYDWEYNHKRIDTTIGPGGTGWYMTNKLLSILLEHGGAIRYRTGVNHLKLDETGKVVGAVAQDPGGEVTVDCNVCILAAGAFSRNQELTNRFNPYFYQEGVEPVHVFTCATCTGDGITMCEEVGADIDFHNARAGMFGPMRHPFGTASLVAGTSRYGILVNTKGEIYDKGGFGEAVSPLAFEPGRIVWQITNDASIARAIEESMGRPQDVPGCDMNPIYQNWRAELDKELAWETMYKGETLQELGEKLHIPAEKLQSAIEVYNSTCGKPEQGMSPQGPVELPPKDAMEDGPYYGILMKLFHENALGGIVIDENTQVLKNGKPVSGLYATGDNTRGVMMPGRVGAEYIEGTISALTFALCSGWIAGGEAAGH